MSTFVFDGMLPRFARVVLPAGRRECVVTRRCCYMLYATCYMLHAICYMLYAAAANGGAADGGVGMIADGHLHVHGEWHATSMCTACIFETREGYGRSHAYKGYSRAHACVRGKRSRSRIQGKRSQSGLVGAAAAQRRRYCEEQGTSRFAARTAE